MRHRGLHAAQREPVRDDLTDVRKRYFAYFDAEVTHRRECRGHRIDHGAVYTRGVPGVIDADA